MDMGQKFELYVVRLFKDLEKSNVRHSIQYTKPTRCEIDIQYKKYLILEHYVECKYREPPAKVGLEEVSKFYAVLDMMDFSRGEIVTNTYYNKRATDFAKSKGIKIYDKDDLIKWEKERRGLMDYILKRDVTNIEKRIRQIH